MSNINVNNKYVMRRYAHYVCLCMFIMRVYYVC